MSVQIPTDENCRTPDDQALLIAWRRFIDYDVAAEAQKVSHNNSRSLIIYLGFAASFMAVAMAYLSGQNNSGSTTVVFIQSIFQRLGSSDANAGLQVVQGLATVVQWSLVILPILTAAVLTYASQFAPSLSWVSYRMGAELIRREIYLYRMTAGDYFSHTLEEQRELLLQNLEKADKRVLDIGAPEPYLETAEQIGDIASYVKDNHKTLNPSDDGFAPMSIYDYIDQHVRPQVDWYIKRSHSDYANLRKWRIVTLTVAGAGSVLAAVSASLGPLVAITTAAGTAIAMYVELKMYGHTYGLYHPIANRLQLQLAEWSILAPAEKQDPARVADLVQCVEDAFQGEREQWMQQAIQATNSFEQSLLRNVSQKTGQAAGGTSSDDTSVTQTSSYAHQEVTTDPSTAQQTVATTVITSKTSVPVAAVQPAVAAAGNGGNGGSATITSDSSSTSSSGTDSQPPANAAG